MSGFAAQAGQKASATLNVTDWPIEQVIPYERNPRKNAGAVAKVANSIREFGFRQPLVVDTNRVLVVGHTRLLAARSLGLASVPVHVAEDLTPAQAKAYRIADNRSGDEAEWDDALLGLELIDLQGLDFDLSLTGFDPLELRKIAAGSTREEDPDVDLTPPQKPKSERGVVYQLGRHRVMCGDAVESTAWDALMAGEMARMVWADAPYGVSYADKNVMLNAVAKGNRIQTPIENDHIDENALADLLRAAFALAWAHSTAGAAFYAAAPAGPLHHVFATVLKDLGVWRHTLQWVKDGFVLGRCDYQYRHEPIFYGWKEGAAHTWNGGRSQSSVLEFPRPKSSRLHPTMKPVDLVRRCVENSTHADAIVVDPFAGSGTTLIACEQSARVGFVMEISPAYCDVIRRRYAEFVSDPSLAP